MEATVVFQKHWDAINAMAYHDDGSPVLDPDTGKHLYKYRYIIHQGSSRSSKTVSILQACYLNAYRGKGERISVWRATKKDCKDTVGKDMEDMYPSLPNYKYVTYNKTETIYRFPTGSRIEITGTDEANKAHGYKTTDSWLNEPYDISRATFDQIDQRCERHIIIDYNPKIDHWVDELKKNPRAIVIHSALPDNPFCPAESRRKILGYQPISMCYAVQELKMPVKKAMSYDLVANPAGLTPRQLNELKRCRLNEEIGTADAYNWSVYGLGVKGERPNRIFRWQPISVQEYMDLEAEEYGGVDWGLVDPWGVLKAKYYDGALYLHEVNYTSENELRRKLTPTELKQVEGDDEGLVMWRFRQLGFKEDAVIVCDNNRPAKIRALKQAGYECAIAASKLKGSVLDGISLLKNLKVYYTVTSVNLAAEQEAYSYATDRYGVVLEKPEEGNDHLMDPARYVANYLRTKGIIKAV